MALTTPYSKIKVRRDSVANWIAQAPILASGEIGLETDTGVIRIGDGASAWSALPGFRSVRSARKAADQNNIGTAYADVTELGLAVDAAVAYGFEFVLLCTSEGITSGIDVACNGPASPTLIVYDQPRWTSTTAHYIVGATEYDAPIGNDLSSGAEARIYRVAGVLVNGANAGTLIARAKRESGGSTGPNVLAGSYGMLWRL
jgi:hypothetical protein